MTDKINRQTLLHSDEFSHIKEALVAGAHANGTNDIFKPIRETPMSAFFDKSEKSMLNNKMNPNLDKIWFSRYGIRMGDMAKTNSRIGDHQLRETVSIPNTLSALKIFDQIIEGAEPFDAWKEYTRIVTMDTPKVNVPVTKYTDTVGGDPSDQKSIDIYKEAGGTPPAIGGKTETVELDCSGTNNSYRGTISVNRNDVKDNNFLAVEQSLKNAGNEFYYMMGVKLLNTTLDDSRVPTDTKANLDNTTPNNSELEAFIEVIRSRFPGQQRNRADTMFINPADAAKAIKNAGTTGDYPFLSRFLLGPEDNTDVINNSGLAQALGLRDVYETPQMPVGKVLITKKETAQVTGIREDLTIENYDLTPGGIYQSDLLMRVDTQMAHPDVGAFIITGF